MSQDPKRPSAGNASSSPATIPRPPPLPAPRPFQQRARDAARSLLGYASRPPSPQGVRDDDRFTLGSSQFTRSSSLGATQDATTSHRTGLEIHSLSINDSGSHAIIAGKEIFKTVKVEDGHCAEDFNLRTAIRSTPTQASGQPRQIYSIDIADVAWAKGDSNHLVAAATSSGKIIVYDLGHAGLQAAQLHEHFRQVHNVTFNPHRGSLLLSGSQDGTVRLWDLRDVKSQVTTLQSKRKYSGQSDGVRDVKWSPVEGYDFAFGTDNGDVQRWDMRNLKSAKVRVPAHSLACNTVDWHPDGKHILSASSDKTVRVFDVSTSRPRKAAWEIKAAFPVMNARWRPSCQSVMPHDNGAQQCTQIVTAYDVEHPIMHVWDFRRPLLPFRELAPHPSAPSDLLWHSQDLLWTVGREGAFIQTDVQHTAKVIDRCNLQAIDVSARGELSFVAQARQQRRKPKPPPMPPPPPLPSRTNTSLSTSPETTFLSRSWQDDSLDHSFLSWSPVKRQARSHSSSRVHGAFSSSSTSTQHQSATIKLDDILLNRKSFRPQQFACRGQLESHNNPEPVAFVAQRARIEVPATSNDDDFLREVEDAFEANIDHCNSIGFNVTASVWKMVGHCTMVHLNDRVALKRKRAAGKSSSPAHEPTMTTSIEALAKRLASQHLKSPMQSPGTLRPVSTIAQQLAHPESTSNVPTPLARPSTSGKLATSQQPAQSLPDPDKDDKLALPPSIASTHTSPPQLPVEPSQARDRRLTLENLEGLQKLQPKEDHGTKNEMVKRWSSQPKVPLSLDPVDDKGVKIPPAKLEKHDSGESFQFLEESGGSRESSFPASLASSGSPTLQRMMVQERPSRAKMNEQTRSYAASVTDNEGLTGAHESMLFEGSGTLANSAVATMENSGNTSMNTSDEDLRKRQTDTTDFAFRAREDLRVKQKRSQGLDIASSVTEQIRDGELFAGADFLVSRQPHQEPKNNIPGKLVETMATWSLQDASPVDSVVGEEEIDLEEDKPWSLVEMLYELINHYTKEQPYPQMASLLLLLVGPLLPRTHPLPVTEIHAEISGYVDYFVNTLGWDAADLPALVKQSFEQPLMAGLHPLQVESILSAYHEQLLSHRLFDEAAMLRKLAYPAYPAVYEDFLRENEVSVVCGQCGKAFPKDRTLPFLRCDGCRERQMKCPICWEARSAYEQGDGGKLLSCCLACGHGGHAACLHEWFAVAEGGMCPTEGCGCVCTPAEEEEEEVKGKAEETQKMKVKVRSDEWRVGESRAVEGVRGMV